MVKRFKKGSPEARQYMVKLRAMKGTAKKRKTRKKNPSLSTAKLRALAWEAKERGEYAQAAKLYDQAIARYPASDQSALAKRDITMLRKAAKIMRSMVGENPVKRVKKNPSRAFTYILQVEENGRWVAHSSYNHLADAEAEAKRLAKQIDARVRVVK